MAFTHGGVSERGLVIGPGAPPVFVTLATNTTQPLYAAPLIDPLAMCGTCGAPDQSIGRKCHYCAVTVQSRP